MRRLLKHPSIRLRLTLTYAAVLLGTCAVLLALNLVGAIAHFMQTVEPYPKAGAPRPPARRRRERGEDARR